MQAWQRIWSNIAAQLRGMHASSKLLVASLMIILVMVLFLVALYAGRTTMSPLPVTLTAESRTQALQYLENANIPYQERDGRIYVPAEQRYTILGQLTQNQVLRGENIDFDRLASEASPFMSDKQSKRNLLITKMKVLERMIMEMNGIQRATVIIDQPEGSPGLGRAAIPPSASVSVVTASGGELSTKQVDAIARLVSGSHGGLKIEHVSVVDANNGRSHQARRDDAVSSGQHLELKLTTERVVEQKLADFLRYIPGVNVKVNVLVDARQEEKRVDSFMDPKSGVVNESNRTLSSTSHTPGGQPGVQPNTGISLPGTGRAGSDMSDERSETTLATRFPAEASHVRDPKGFAVKINATVNVPRSYFIRLYKLNQNTPDAADPDAASLDALVKIESDRIVAAVEPLVDTGTVEGAVRGTVMVSMVPDFAPAFASSDGGTVGIGASGGSFAAGGSTDSLVRYIGLGALALVSLAMMFLMVRKANVREPLPSMADIVGVPPALDSDTSELVGEADESTPALEGVELDDKDLRRQQMLDQINDMARKSPDEAAGLLRKWIKTEV